MSKNKKKGRANEIALATARRRRSVERDYIAGLVSITDLAVRYGVSISTISNDLKAIFYSWKEQEEEQLEELRKPIDRTHAVRALTEVWRLAGQGFKRSQQNKEQITTEYKQVECEDCKGTGWKDGDENSGEWCPTCDGDKTKTVEQVTVKRTGQAGDPAFLRVGVDAIREVARLKALYPEKPAGGNNQIDLNVYNLSVDPNDTDPDDIFQAKMLVARMGKAGAKRAIIDARSESSEGGES